MNWDFIPANVEVASAYAAYKNYVMSVATHYAGSRLIEGIDLAFFDEDQKLALSSNFDEPLTTIRTVGDLSQSMQQGEYGQICVRLATVQLCTAFEVLFDTITDIYAVPEDKQPFSARYHFLRPDSVKLGNKSIRQIRKLHTHLGISSVLDRDEVLIKLSAIIDVRNCIVHSSGRVMSVEKTSRLKAYGIRTNVGDMIQFDDNIFDDFLHYMMFHVTSCMKVLP